MAIAAGVDRACYAKALLSLEDMRVPVFANGGAGADLRGRVARLLDNTAAVVGLAGCGAVVNAGAVRADANIDAVSAVGERGCRLYHSD